MYAQAILRDVVAQRIWDTSMGGALLYGVAASAPSVLLHLGFSNARTGVFTPRQNNVKTVSVFAMQRQAFLVF